jgi:hypothetical protein
MKAKTVEKRWPLAPATGPTGLAIDVATKRLFAGCDKLLAVVDASSGAVVTTVPIGDGCDGVAFDNKLKTVFASCGEGKLTVIHEDSPAAFSVTDNAVTKRSARTLAVDEATHTVYLPAAEYEAVTPAGQRRPPMVPGSFQVLVVKQ